VFLKGENLVVMSFVGEEIYVTHVTQGTADKWHRHDLFGSIGVYPDERKRKGIKSRSDDPFYT
jgi:hypothetical protein